VAVVDSVLKAGDFLDRIYRIHRISGMRFGEVWCRI